MNTCRSRWDSEGHRCCILRCFHGASGYGSSNVVYQWNGGRAADMKDQNLSTLNADSQDIQTVPLSILLSSLVTVGFFRTFIPVVKMLRI